MTLLIILHIKSNGRGSEQSWSCRRHLLGVCSPAAEIKAISSAVCTKDFHSMLPLNNFYLDVFGLIFFLHLQCSYFIAFHFIC